MLVAAMVSFVGTLIAFAGVTALIRGWFETGKGYLFACSLTLLSLSVGLGSATIGLALQFQPALFRAYQVGVALLAMLGLALGMVELVSRRFPAVFTARLLILSFAVVSAVILTLDPLREVSEPALFPSAEQMYLDLPLTLLAAAHAGVVLVVSACFLVVAMRAWRGDDDTLEIFLPGLLLVVAALFIFVSTRPELISLPPLAYVSLLTAAAVSIWVASVRAMRSTRIDDEEDEDEDGVLPEPDPEPDPDSQRHSHPRRAVTEDESTFEEWLFGANPEHKTEVVPTPPPDALAQACGYIVIFTLREGASRPFDRLVESTVRAIHANEPGTIAYTCHAVQDAPQQRIFYELYRDRSAMTEHEAQPHVRRFLAEREQYVLATNVVRLKLNSHTGVRDHQAAHGKAPDDRALD